MKYLFIAGFGLAGVFLRYFIGSFFRPQLPGFPWATLGINLVGCFLIGVIYVYGVEKAVISEDLRVGLMVGLLGGFTTFSAFGLETALLLKTGQSAMALGYVLVSTIFGILMTFAGMAVSR